MKLRSPKRAAAAAGACAHRGRLHLRGIPAIPAVFS